MSLSEHRAADSFVERCIKSRNPEPIIKPIHVVSIKATVDRKPEPAIDIKDIQCIDPSELYETCDLDLPLRSPASSAEKATSSAEVSAPSAEKSVDTNKYGVGTAIPQVGQCKFSLRREFAEAPLEVLSNHFVLSSKPQSQFHVYEILNIPTVMSDHERRVIVRSAICAWEFLKDNEEFFATDELRYIVSWKNLHHSIRCLRDTDMPNDLVWTPSPLNSGEQRMNLAFKYNGTLKMDRLREFMKVHTKKSVFSKDSTLSNFNFDPLIVHLNTVILKSLSNEVFSTSSHRFYFKSGWESLGNSASLCVMRGYQYRIKPGMQANHGSTVHGRWDHIRRDATEELCPGAESVHHT